MRLSHDDSERECFSTKLLTRQNEEDDPVHDQHGPEDGNVEKLEKCARERYSHGPRGPVPKLEFGQPANEGLELLVLLGRQRADGTILHLLVKGIA